MLRLLSLCLLVVVLFAVADSARDRRVSGIGDFAGKGGLGKLAGAVSAMGEGYTGKNSTEVMEKLQAVTASVLDRILSQEKHTAVIAPSLGGILKGNGPQILPGSPEDGSLALPKGAIAAVTVINNWDFNADHSALISAANKYAELSPPCAIVLVAKNVTKPASSSAAGASPAPATPSAPAPSPRFRSLFSPAAAVAAQQTTTAALTPGFPFNLGPKASAAEGRFIVVPQKTRQLQGLTIPNLYVVVPHQKNFIVLAAGDLSLAFGKKKDAASAPSIAPSTAPPSAPPSSPAPTF